MKVDAGAPARTVIYSLALLYLFADLFVFKGPLWKALKDSDPRSEKALAAQAAQGVAARVFYQPILLTQVDREVQYRLWTKGQTVGDLPAERLFEHRMAALNGLFDLHLLRTKVRFNAGEISVSEEQVAQAGQRFRRRFASESLFNEALANQGWTGERELVARLRAKLEQEAYLEKLVLLEPAEGELRSFFEEHREDFVRPERVEARHLFFAHLQNPDGAALRRAQEARAALAQGADFGELARQLSEDFANKEHGGSLGWMTRARLPRDFSEAVFTLPLKTPSIVETTLGVHLLEVLARQPARPQTFEEVHHELAEAFANQRRAEGTSEYLRKLRHRESANLELFREVLQRPWSLSET